MFISARILIVLLASLKRAIAQWATDGTIHDPRHEMAKPRCLGMFAGTGNPFVKRAVGLGLTHSGHLIIGIVLSAGGFEIRAEYALRDQEPNEVSSTARPARATLFLGGNR